MQLSKKDMIISQGYEVSTYYQTAILEQNLFHVILMEEGENKNKVSIHYIHNKHANNKPLTILSLSWCFYICNENSEICMMFYL